MDGLLQEVPTHLVVITALYLFVWFKSLFNKGMLIDDQEGVNKYSERFDAKKDEITRTYKDKDREFGMFQFNPVPGFPGSIIRWLRINMGKKFQVLGTNKKGHDVYGYRQDPFRHHLFSLIMQYLNLLLAYSALSYLFGNEVAFFAVLLFSVHPVGCQAVAWISGYGYLCSLFCALACLNLAFYLDNLYIIFPSIFILTLVGSFILLAGAHIWAIFALLGMWPEAALTFIAALIVIIRQWGDVVSHRKDAFRKQNMGHSTILHWRKPIVMFKTFWYYVKFVVYPMKLGLFHTWGYHYEPTIDRIDRLFFKGFISAAAVLFFIVAGPLEVSFSLVWFVMFLATFMNAITAQQFVVDRYVFIPAFGYSLLLSFLLQGHPEFLAFIVGLYAMRSMVHIPTFRSEIDFYLSNANTSNFLDSEVALGNLGVVYMNNGMPGSAADVWMKATKINKFYDVPWYNLYSLFKSNGMIKQAKEYLKNCLNAKTVHFKDHWEKEMADIERYLELTDSGKMIQNMNNGVTEATKWR